MFLNLTLRRRHRDFRLLFIDQLVSAFGTFLEYGALPVQIYELTHSPWTVGSLARRSSCRWLSPHFGVASGRTPRSADGSYRSLKRCSCAVY